MTPSREDGSVPAFLQARVPVELYEMVDAYAEGAGLTLSEALRRLVVQALEAQGSQLSITDIEGTRTDDSWRDPLPSSPGEREETP